MYSGASNPNLHLIEGNDKLHHNHHSLSNLNINRSTKPSNSNEDENNLLSLKKSAEIAAVFSGAKINQMTDIVDPLSTDPDSDFSHPEVNQRFFSRKQQYSDSNMHSSLGYFP